MKTSNIEINLLNANSINKFSEIEELNNQLKSRLSILHITINDINPALLCEAGAAAKSISKIFFKNNYEIIGQAYLVIEEICDSILFNKINAFDGDNFLIELLKLIDNSLDFIDSNKEIFFSINNKIIEMLHSKSSILNFKFNINNNSLKNTNSNNNIFEETDGKFTYLKAENLEYINDFFEEANESVIKTEEQLLILEENPDSSEAINIIFRNIHSMKGSSGFLGLKEITMICHSAESLLDKCRNKIFSVSENIINLMLVANDRIKNLLVNLKKRVNILRGENNSTSLENISINDMLNSINSVISFENTNVESKAIEVKNLSDEQYETGIIIQDSCKKILELKNDKPKENTIEEASAAVSDSVRVTTQKIDAVSELTGELLISLSLLKKRAELSNSDKLLFEQIHNLEMNMDLLRLNIIKMRMIPIKNIYDKFNRLIRDLSKKSNKVIKYETSGGNIEIDRRNIFAFDSYNPELY